MAHHSRTVDGAEREFLASYDVARYARPSVSVDIVLLSLQEDALHALLLTRSRHPFRGKAALPGGFVGMSESLEEAAERVLREKAGLRRVFLEQLFTFGEPTRDPRTRVISVAYVALVSAARFGKARQERAALSGRIEVPWADQKGGAVNVYDAAGLALPLAFDHAQLIGMAIKRLRGKLSYAPIGYQLLPDKFTLLALQRVHEVILGRPLNKDSFRRKMLASGELVATGRHETDVGHRPAELYRFSRRSAT